MVVAKEVGAREARGSAAPASEEGEEAKGGPGSAVLELEAALEVQEGKAESELEERGLVVREDLRLERE